MVERRQASYILPHILHTSPQYFTIWCSQSLSMRRCWLCYSVVTAIRPFLAGSGTDTALFSVKVQAESALCRAACSCISFLQKRLMLRL